MKYMSMSQAEKLQAAWLAQHGIKKEDLDKMSPEDREKVLRKMRQDIADEIKRETEDKAKAAAHSPTDIFA